MFIHINIPNVNMILYDRNLAPYHIPLSVEKECLVANERAPETVSQMLGPCNTCPATVWHKIKKLNIMKLI